AASLVDATGEMVAFTTSPPPPPPPPPQPVAAPPSASAPSVAARSRLAWRLVIAVMVCGVPFSPRPRRRVVSATRPAQSGTPRWSQLLAVTGAASSARTRGAAWPRDDGGDRATGQDPGTRPARPAGAR